MRAGSAPNFGWLRNRDRLATAILTLSPIGYWKQRETSGTVATDASGNARNGTYGASVTLAAIAGPDGYSYPDFAPAGAGGRDAILDNDAFSLSGPASWFALVRPDTSTENRTIVSKAAASNFEWTFRLAAGPIALTIWNSNGSNLHNEVENGAGSTPNGSWSAVCATKPTSTTTARARLFRNSGTPVASSVFTNGSNSYTNGTAPVNIGWRADSDNTVRFDGSIAHVAIFNYQLSDAQVQTLMDAAHAMGWF